MDAQVEALARAAALRAEYYAQVRLGRQLRRSSAALRALLLRNAAVAARYAGARAEGQRYLRFARGGGRCCGLELLRGVLARHVRALQAECGALRDGLREAGLAAAIERENAALRGRLAQGLAQYAPARVDYRDPAAVFAAQFRRPRRSAAAAEVDQGALYAWFAARARHFDYFFRQCALVDQLTLRCGAFLALFRLERFAGEAEAVRNYLLSCLTAANAARIRRYLRRIPCEARGCNFRLFLLLLLGGRLLRENGSRMLALGERVLLL